MDRSTYDFGRRAQPPAPPARLSIPPANRDAARMLDQIAQLLVVRGENPYRVRAYQEAALHLGGLPIDLVELWRDGQLRTIPGVGPSIAARLDEFLRTGVVPYLEELRRTTPRGVERLMEVPGVGPARARVLAERLDLHTPDDLAEAARAHRLRDLPGFGPLVEQRLLVEAERWAQRERRLLLGVAWPEATALIQEMKELPVFAQVSIAGSLRRMRETIGDIDLLAAATDSAAATMAFSRLSHVGEVLSHGPTKASVLLDDGLQVDLLVVEPASWGAALQHFTGSKEHNIALRTFAQEKGLRLNEYGVYDEATGRRTTGSTEESIYRAVGMEWIPPELRENRGEIQAALARDLPALIEVADLRGDLHVHSDWSDGTASIEAMAQAARDLGLEYIAFTDHSQSLTIANGLTPERFRAQRPVIDRLNHELAPFRILQGAEVDILPDGDLDLPNDLLDELDYVGVSVHTRFRLPREEMTRRIIRGISHPRVATLNHPTGRMLNRRPGYEVDLERVLRAAADLGVSVEINSQPNRLDLDDVWARRAKELGCRLMIDSDAHAPSNFAYLRYGVAVARRGWLTSTDARNTLPLPAFERWLSTRRRRKAA